MSPDGKEPNAIWQGSTEPPWAESFDQLPAQQEPPPFSSQGDEGDLSDVQDEYDGVPSPGAIPRITELLGQYGQYLALILAPLLLGLLTFVFILTHVMSQQSALPAGGLLPITFVIIAIAVAQGVSVYYAGMNNRMWVPGTVCGLCLFLLIGCFCVYGLIPGTALLLVLVGIMVLLLRLYLSIVPEGYIAIVHALGKFSHVLYPGPSILLPWEKVTHRLQTRETPWTTPLQRVQMSPDTDVTLKGMVAYQLVPEYAHMALDHVDKWEENLQALFVTTLQSMATTFTPDDFLPWPRGLRGQPPTSAINSEDQIVRWENINTYLYQQMRDRVDLWGVEINWVRIRDVTLVPHGAAVTDVDPVAAPPQPVVPPKVLPMADEVTMALPKDAIIATPAPGPAPEVASVPPQVIDEDVLITAYKAIQSGTITDPDTIRGIAGQFVAIARDMKASQSVSFDADRAAQNLYAQASKYEEQQEALNMPPYNDNLKPDWNTRRQTDENMMAGG